MSQRTDILGLGVSTIDELILLEAFPKPNHKQGVLSRNRQCGGLTGSALVAAARQGCRCGHVITLGAGELSAFLRDAMTREGIRLFEDETDPAVSPYYSLILTERDGGERSILWDNSKTRPPAVKKWREEILAAKCLFVDHIFADSLVEVAAEARARGIDVAGDFERATPGVRALMEQTNHLILPMGFCEEYFGQAVTAEEAVARLAATPGRSLACVTDGTNGCWYATGDAPEKIRRQPIFPVDKVVDTTGCGDVFHGVYAAGLIQNHAPETRIRRAAAAAAMKTRIPGAQAGAPTREELNTFLEDK